MGGVHFILQVLQFRSASVCEGNSVLLDVVLQ